MIVNETIIHPKQKDREVNNNSSLNDLQPCAKPTAHYMLNCINLQEQKMLPFYI